MTDAVQTPRIPCAYDVVEIVDLRDAPRLKAIVEVVRDPNLLLRLERAAAVPARAPVRWFDGDTAWQAVSAIEQVDETSVNCQLAPPPEWEPAPVRQSLRAVVGNAPILVRIVDESRIAAPRIVHAVCLDVSATGCRSSWPGRPPSAGERVEIAWEAGAGYDDGEPQWVSARVVRVIDLAFGKRQVGFQFELGETAHASRVREWHQTWLGEQRRRLVEG